MLKMCMRNWRSFLRNEQEKSDERDRIMANFTKEDFDVITKMLYEKNPHLTGAEWVLIAFDRQELYEIITSLWDAAGIVQLRAVLEKMLHDLEGIEKKYNIKNEVNPKWFN